MTTQKYQPVFEDDIDEKHSVLLTTTRPVQDEPLRQNKRMAQYIIPALLMIIGVMILTWQPIVGNLKMWRKCSGSHRPYEVDNVSAHTTTKVNLEAHIMSKCPDARDCLQQLILPTMEQVSELVDFKLSYIGSIDPRSDDVSCMHGPSECLGNIIQLCAQREYPDPKLYLGFANCMTSDYKDIPDRQLIEGCAMEHGLDFDVLNDCISDEGNSTDLLRKSVEWSAENHVRKSCTVRLNGNVRCVRDGGRWYDCPGRVSGVRSRQRDHRTIQERIAATHTDQC